MFFSASCSASWRKKKKSPNTLLHLKIWTLLEHLFDLIRALQEGLFFLIGGVYMLGGNSIPYYWYCQCVCHSATITSFMGHGKHSIAYFWTVTTFLFQGICPHFVCSEEKDLCLWCSRRDSSHGESAKHTSIKEKIMLMKLRQKSSHLMFLIKSKVISMHKKLDT